MATNIIPPYEEYEINEKVLTNLQRHYADRKIKEYFNRTGIWPDSETVETFVIPSELMEEYKKYLYARVLQGEPEESQDDEGQDGEDIPMDYDEFVRLTYNVTDIYNPTKLFSSTAATPGIGYMEIDGVSVQPTSDYSFKKIGTHIVNVLLKDPSWVAPLKFSDVPSLRSIVIPSCVNGLGDATFNRCQGIEQIICLATVPPSFNTLSNLSTSTFYNINGHGTLYVPKSAISQYNSTWMGTNSSYNLRTNNWTMEALPEPEE